MARAERRAESEGGGLPQPTFDAPAQPRPENLAPYPRDKRAAECVILKAAAKRASGSLLMLATCGVHHSPSETPVS